VLAVEAQRRPAGGEHLEPWRGGQQLAHDRRRLGEVLEVVGHEQQPAVLQVRLQRLDHGLPPVLLDPERSGDGVGHQRRVLLGRERDEVDAVLEVRRQLGCCLEREARLARPTRAGERHEPDAAHQRGQLLDLGATTDQRRRRRRQGAALAHLLRLDEQRPVLIEDGGVQRLQLRAGNAAVAAMIQRRAAAPARTPARATAAAWMGSPPHVSRSWSPPRRAPEARA
jgi:hypothetical protein